MADFLVEFEMEKERDLFWDFVKTISLLRKNCPWDKSQTLESLSEHLSEEVSEAVEAVSLTSERLREELGDLLLVILMMCSASEENGLFDVKDVLMGIDEKVKFRHPHIFGKDKASTPEEVKKIWERKKIEEKENRKCVLEKASLIQKEASKSGFDWESSDKVVEKLNEEIAELVLCENDLQREEELGDILFVTVHLANHLRVDPVAALKKTIDKFNKRFAFVKEKMAESGLTMTSDNIETMEKYWRQKAEILVFGNKRGKNEK
ncbi:MazG family protein [candidate division WOR-3 bacterium]|nr:MazG family protein [candidate division WOR-3 bacterium]